MILATATPKLTRRRTPGYFDSAANEDAKSGPLTQAGCPAGPSNWLLARSASSILMVGFGFSLRVVGSPVEVEEEEDSKN